MNPTISAYLRKIGKKGGHKSRRALSSSAAREMVQVREARRAFKKFQVSCFWSVDPLAVISAADIPWVIDSLRRHGDRTAWIAAQSLEKLRLKGTHAAH